MVSLIGLAVVVSTEGVAVSLIGLEVVVVSTERVVVSLIGLLEAWILVVVTTG